MWIVKAGIIMLIVLGKAEKEEHVTKVGAEGRLGRGE